MRMGRRSVFREGIRPDSHRESFRIGPPAGRRPAVGLTLTFSRRRSSLNPAKARFPARKHYRITEGKVWQLRPFVRTHKVANPAPPKCWLSGTKRPRSNKTALRTTYPVFVFVSPRAPQSNAVSRAAPRNSTSENRPGKPRRSQPKGRLHLPAQPVRGANPVPVPNHLGNRAGYHLARLGHHALAHKLCAPGRTHRSAV